MSSVTRSQRILDSLVGRQGLTEAGKNWLAGAADPFHDLALNVTGYPDQCQSDSVVQLIKLTKTIACPASITTGNWDCRVHMYPWLVEVPMYPLNNSGSVTAPAFSFTGGSKSTTAGGLCVDSVASGTTIGVGQTGDKHTVINLPPQYYNGAVRVIGQGFEVHNTTSQLYKQGAVCCYKQPTPDYFNCSTYPFLGGSVSTNGIGYPSSVLLPTAPYAQSDALLLSGSKQWEAKDGCYVVGVFHSDTIPLQDTITVIPTAYQSNVPEGTGAYFSATPGQLNNGTSTILYWNDVFWTQQDAHGAYFTGLSQQTTITINWNILIERFPSAADADLTVLAKPSPRYDPIAVELYSLCMQNMPVGVPVSENGLGDWFMKVIGRARDIVMPALRVGSALHPKIGMLTGAMDALGISGNAKGGGAQSNPSPFQQKGQQQQRKQQNKILAAQASFGPFAPGTGKLKNMTRILGKKKKGGGGSNNKPTLQQVAAKFLQKQKKKDKRAQKKAVKALVMDMD